MMLQGELLISRYNKFANSGFMLKDIHLGGLKPDYMHGIKFTLPSSYNK